MEFTNYRDVLKEAATPEEREVVERAVDHVKQILRNPENERNSVSDEIDYIREITVNSINRIRSGQKMPPDACQTETETYLYTEAYIASVKEAGEKGALKK